MLAALVRRGVSLSEAKRLTIGQATELLKRLDAWYVEEEEGKVKAEVQMHENLLQGLNAVAQQMANNNKLLRQVGEIIGKRPVL